MRRRPALAAAGLLALAWLLTLTVHPWADESVTDLVVRRDFAASFLDGSLPYRDVAFEYPPLAAPLIALAGLAGTGEDAYWAGFAAMTFVLAGAVLLLVGRLAQLSEGNRFVALLGVAVSPLLLGAVIRTHFDLAAVALSLGALVAILVRRPSLGFALIGVGTMTKLFPLVLAPVAVAWLWGRGDGREALRGIAALCLTAGAVGLAALALSPTGLADSVSYQLERPVQVESGPASTLTAIAALGGDPVVHVRSHRSSGLLHPLADEVGGLGLGLLAITVVTLSVVASRRPEPRALIVASLTAAAAFALFGKVLSPQFLIWVVPLLALALAWRAWALAAGTALAMALTLAEFPSRYVDLVAGDPTAAWIVGLRNLALLSAVLLGGRALLAREARRADSSRRVPAARRGAPALGRTSG